jgi:hypothetical protein
MLPDSYYQEIDSLTEMHESSVGRLACAGVIDREAFASYREGVTRFVKVSRQHSVVSKRGLQIINSAITYCQCNAEFTEDSRFVDDFGAFMARAFYCIIGDEDIDDRRPGVPRII